MKLFNQILKCIGLNLYIVFLVIILISSIFLVFWERKFFSLYINQVCQEFSYIIYLKETDFKIYFYFGRITVLFNNLLTSTFIFLNPPS